MLNEEIAVVPPNCGKLDGQTTYTSSCQDYLIDVELINQRNGTMMAT